MTRKRLILIFAVTLLMGGGTFWLAGCKGGGGHAEHASQKAAKFHCPMHPTYVSDRPGDCPICNMRLVPIESEESHEQAVEEAQEQGGERKPLFYRHPMNPKVTSPEPKQDEMGMDYVPVYEEEVKTEGRPEKSDRAAISLSPEKQQLIGVRAAPVVRRDLETLLRASGRVAYDPDLYNAIVEYREALKSKEKVKDSPWPDVQERSEALINSSVLRLRQMGLAQDQIDRLGGAAENPTNLLLSEKGGSVWVYAQIYEYEAGTVKAGQMMEVVSSASPDRSLRGRVVAVDSILDPQTRTLRVRGEIRNSGDLLRPEMYVDVIIHVNLGRKLAVPAEAVLDSGTRKIVFVETGPGKYDPREIKVGRKAEDHYEVSSGLKEGEKVVVSANFLIDSESRLKAALGQPGGGHSH